MLLLWLSLAGMFSVAQTQTISLYVPALWAVNQIPLSASVGGTDEDGRTMYLVENAARSPGEIRFEPFDGTATIFQGPEDAIGTHVDGGRTEFYSCPLTKTGYDEWCSVTRVSPKLFTPNVLETETLYGQFAIMPVSFVPSSATVGAADSDVLPTGEPDAPSSVGASTSESRTASQSRDATTSEPTDATEFAGSTKIAKSPVVGALAVTLIFMGAYAVI